MEKKSIVYFGPQGSFTHIAAQKRYGKGYVYIPLLTIHDVFRAVEEGWGEKCVVPIENTGGGLVLDTIDELLSNGFRKSENEIIEELVLPINLILMGQGAMGTIRKVYSHRHPLAYARDWINIHLPGVQIEPVDSTPVAAEKASKDKSSAAIASKVQLKLYGLKNFATIETKNKNYTFFYVIGKNRVKGKDYRTSISFSLVDRPGSLNDVLSVLAKEKINLTRIISRPMTERMGEYNFVIDFEGSTEKKNIVKALDLIKKRTVSFYVKGSHPRTSLAV